MNRIILALAATLLAIPQLGFADVNYTQRYIGQGESLSRIPETRVLFKPDKRLSEEWRYYGNNFIREQTLTLFAEKKEYVMDMVLKIYKVVPMDTPTTLRDTATVKVKDLGDETLFGLKTRHYQVDIQYDYVRASANADRIVRQEFWVVPSTTLSAYPTNFIPGITTEKILGEREAYNRAIQGLMVRSRLSVPLKDYPDEYREVYTIELSSLNTKTLDDAYFKIPDEYREVTAEEYRIAQTLLSERRLDRDTLGMGT